MYHIDKNQFDVPFVCGAKNLGEALRRVAEGASMIRTKGEPGTGDVIQAVRHMRTMNKQIRELVSLRDDEVYEAAKQLAVPYDLAKYVHDNGRLPVVNFAAGGVATPADAALMMELGAEGVFVGSANGRFADADEHLAPVRLGNLHARKLQPRGGARLDQCVHIFRHALSPFWRGKRGAAPRRPAFRVHKTGRWTRPVSEESVFGCAKCIQTGGLACGKRRFWRWVSSC